MISSSNKKLKLLEKITTEFSRKELATKREENDQYPFGPFFKSALDKAYEIDFFNTTLPEDLNGEGQGTSELCVLLENICREDCSFGGILFTNTASQELLLEAGETNHLKEIVTSATNVIDYLIAFPIFNNPSEVEHVARATKRNGHYFLSGPIEYLVLGGLSSRAIVPARIDTQEHYSFFLIDLKDRRIKKSETIVSLGFHTCPAVDIMMEGTKGILIGEENSGNLYFERMSDKMQAAISAMSLGVMKGAFKEAVGYCKQREQGGRKIINWSEVKMILAQMGVKVKNAEMILSSVCRSVENNNKGWEECSKAAAIQIQDMACDITTDGIQILGGVGYMKDFGQEKRFRDAKHLQSVFGISPMKIINYLDRFISKSVN